METTADTLDLELDATVRDIIENSVSAALATVTVFLVERLEQGATLADVIPEIAAQVRDSTTYKNYKKENR